MWTRKATERRELNFRAWLLIRIVMAGAALWALWRIADVISAMLPPG